MLKTDQTDQKVLCRTPTPGKGCTRIAQWKYQALRAAIQEVLAEHPNGVLFKHLPHLTSAKLGKEVVGKIGSISWYTTTVKLDLEVRGELERVAGETPQRLKIKRSG